MRLKTLPEFHLGREADCLTDARISLMKTRSGGCSGGDTHLRISLAICLDKLSPFLYVQPVLERLYCASGKVRRIQLFEKH